MGGATSVEVRACDPEELSTKSRDAKCAKSVVEIICDREVDGDGAYVIKETQTDDPAGFKELLVDFAPTPTKQVHLKAALKKLPEHKGEDDAQNAAAARSGARAPSVSEPVETNLREWSADDLATLVEGMGEDPTYAKIARAIRDVGMDGAMMAE